MVIVKRRMELVKEYHVVRHLNISMINNVKHFKLIV